MKTKIILSLLGLLFISGAFTEGCDEEKPKPDYITINITIQGWVNEIECKDQITGKGEVREHHRAVDSRHEQQQADAT